MFKFLKKIPISKVFTKRRIFFLCILVIFILLILPTKQASAFSLDPRTWIPALIGMIIKLILKISEIALQLSNWFLKVAIGNPFGVPLTIPGQAPFGNPIIYIGWTLLRDLVNMLFILGLAYIGLATALNIRKFETGKTFKNLILIAILINFTPVICGAIVDMANIISNFFLQGVNFSALQDIFGHQQQALKQALGNFSMDNAMIMLKSIILIGYGFIAAFIILLYAAIFLVRAPIIWMLVIFSPLAFFASIFEQTNKYFKQWWNLFLQWAIIVIPASFFLYLSQQVLVNRKDLLNVPDTGLMGKLISEIAPYGVALFFLIIGLIMTTKINAMGANATMSGAKTLLRKGGRGASNLSRKGAIRARNKWNARTGGPDANDSGYKEWAQDHKARASMRRMGRYMFGGETDAEKANRGKTGKVVQGVARTAVGAVTGGSTIWARRASKKIGAVADESAKKDMSAAQEKFKGKSLASKKQGIESSFAKTRVAAMMSAIDEGDNISAMNLSDSKLKRVMKDAAKIDPSSMFKLRDANPFMAAEIANTMHLSDSRKKEAGIYEKEEDTEKYKQEVLHNDVRLSRLSDEEKEKAKAVDEDGNLVERNGQQVYKINYQRTVSENDASVRSMKYDEKERRSLKYDAGHDKAGQNILDKDGNLQYKIDISPIASKLIAEIKTVSMEKTWNEDLAEQIASSDVAHDFWEGAQVGKAASLFSSKFIESFRKKMQENGEEHYAENNVKLSSYFKNTAARSLGLEFDKVASGVGSIEDALQAIVNKQAEIATMEKTHIDMKTREERKASQEKQQTLKEELIQLKENAETAKTSSNKQAPKKIMSQEQYDKKQTQKEQPISIVQGVRSRFQSTPSEAGIGDITKEGAPKQSRFGRSKPTEAGASSDTTGGKTTTLKSDRITLNKKSSTRKLRSKPTEAGPGTESKTEQTTDKKHSREKGRKNRPKEVK